MGAPQVTIETITVTRPLKVIAFTCCVITVILTVTATATADWMLAEGWREGLFMQCVSEGAHKPLPFDMEPVPGCGKLRSAGYLKGCAALCIIGVLTDFFGTLLTCLGLKSTDPNKKYKYYRVSIYALTAAAVIFLLAVIIYPVEFAKDLDQEPERHGVIFEGSIDFDGDGVADHIDDDDDNDGKLDVNDPDDDNDGIPDNEDLDDDNDGILDVAEESDDDDFDNDGIPDDEDNDDDNDGVPDKEENEDEDNDGVPDSEDNDDDNDGVPDNMEDDLPGEGRVYSFGF